MDYLDYWKKKEKVVLYYSLTQFFFNKNMNPIPSRSCSFLFEIKTSKGEMGNPGRGQCSGCLILE